MTGSKRTSSQIQSQRNATTWWCASFMLGLLNMYARQLNIRNTQLLVTTTEQDTRKRKNRNSFSRSLSQNHDNLRLHTEEALAIKTLTPELNKRQEEMGTGFLPWRWRKRERARAGIEPTAAAPSQPDCPGVTVHSVSFCKTLFDFKKSISGLIELKFSGKTPDEVLYAPIYFWVSIFSLRA